MTRTSTPVLYGYWRSTAAYRVRIALNLKKIDCQMRPVHLVRDGGEQHGEAYRALNPQGLVPALAIDGHTLTQSLAIVEYLEETRPWPALLPARPAERARVRALALAIAADTHPLNNLRVLKYLGGTLGVDEAGRNGWYAHWVAQSFAAVERLLADAQTGRFCHGDTPTLADLVLVPQVYNADRFACDMTPYPTIRRIEQACLALPEFDAARPENQSDAPPVL